MMCLFTVAKCGNFSIFFLVNTSWRKSFRLAAVMKNEQSIILLFCPDDGPCDLWNIFITNL